MLSRLLLTILITICIYTFAIANTMTEYEQLYFEVFGEKIIEERINENVFLNVNGNDLGLLKIEYLNMSEKVFIKKESLLNLLKNTLENEDKLNLIKNKLPNTEVTIKELESLKIQVDVNLIKKEISMILPYIYGLDMKIDLNPNPKPKKKSSSKTLIYPTKFSNYTNFAYKNDYDFNNNTQKEETLLFNGAVGLINSAILYNGKVQNSSKLNQLDYNKKLDSYNLALKAGISPIFVPNDLIYLTESNKTSILGITLYDSESIESLTKKKTPLSIDIKEYCKVEIIVNSKKIFEKYLYPGKYNFVNIQLPSYRNDIWFNVNSSQPKQYHFRVYNSLFLAPRKKTYSIQYGLTEKNLDTQHYSQATSLFTYNYGVSNRLSIGISSMITTQEIYNAYLVRYANPIGLSNISLLQDYSINNNKGVLGLKFNTIYYIPNWAKKYLVTAMNSALTYIPKRDYKDPNIDEYLQAEHSVNFENKKYQTKFFFKQNDKNSYAGLSLYIKAFRFFQNYYISGGTQYNSDTNQTITSIRLAQVKSNIDYSRQSYIDYSSYKNNINSKLKIKDTQEKERISSYELDIEQNQDTQKKSTFISKLLVNNNTKKEDIINYTMDIQYDSKTSNTNTKLNIQNWAEDGFIFTTQIAYDLTPNDNIWAINLIGKYIFNIKQHQITPEISQSIASSSGKNKTHLKLSHLYDQKLVDKQVYISSSIVDNNAFSIIRYKDYEKDIRYELSRKNNTVNQALDYTNGYVKLNIVEKENLLSSTVRTAVAFTPSQIGITNSIDSGFILYKPHLKLPKNTKIYAKSNSFGLLSAVGEINTTPKPYEYISNFKNNYIQNSFETIQKDFDISYNSKNNLFNSNYDISQPIEKKVKYKNIKINNYTKKGSQDFIIYSQNYHGYDIEVIDKKEFIFKSKFFNKKTQQPIEPFTFVLLTKLYDKSYIKYGFVDENSEFIIEGLEEGYYVIEIEHYKKIYLNATNINYNEIIYIGDTYLMPKEKKNDND